MLYLFSFIKSLHFFGSLAVPFYLQRLGFSYTQMFLMETIFSICLFLFEVPTGVIADKFGRKFSIFFGSIIFGASFIIIGITHSTYVFILAQIIGSLGMSMISGADLALVYENSKLRGKTDEQATVVASRYNALDTAGSLIAMPLGSVFVSLFQKEGVPYSKYLQALGTTFWATGVALIISSFVILFVKEPPVSSSVKEESALKHAVDGFTAIFKNRTLFTFSLNYAIISGLTFLMFWFYQSLLLENNFPVGVNGFISAGFNLGGMLLLLTTGFFMKTIGVSKTLFLSSIIPGVLYVLVFVFPNSKAVILIAIFGITMLRFFRAPILTTLINTQIANEDRATVLSGVSMIERIVISITYPLAGLLLDYASKYTYLVVGMIIIVVSFLVRVKNVTIDKQITMEK